MNVWVRAPLLFRYNEAGVQNFPFKPCSMVASAWGCTAQEECLPVMTFGAGHVRLKDEMDIKHDPCVV